MGKEKLLKKTLKSDISVKSNDVQIVEVEDNVKNVTIEKNLQPELQRAKSVQEKEETTIIDDKSEPQVLAENVLPKRRLSRGISAIKEHVEIVESETCPATPVEETSLKRRLSKGTSASKEEAVMVENSIELSTLVEDVPKHKSSVGIPSTKESIKITESDSDAITQTAKEMEVERLVSQRGDKQYNEGVDEKDFKGAERQRSIIEDVCKDQVEGNNNTTKHTRYHNTTAHCQIRMNTDNPVTAV